MAELIKDYFITLNCSGPLALNKKQIQATESWVGKAQNHFGERNILINLTITCELQLTRPLTGWVAWAIKILRRQNETTPKNSFAKIQEVTKVTLALRNACRHHHPFLNVQKY